MRRNETSLGSQTVRNLYTNPGFEAVGSAVTTRTNLYTNPSFESVGAAAVVRTNLATNPSFEGVSGVTNVRTNFIQNPSIENGSGVINTRTNLMPDPNAVNALNWFTPTGGGAAPTTTVRNQAGGPVNNNTYTRVTATGTGSSATYFGPAYGQTGAGNAPAATPGLTYTLSAYVRVTMATFASQPQVRLRFKDAAGATLQDFIGTATGATSGAWIRIGVTGTAPANTSYIEFIGGYIALNNATITTGDTVDVSAILVEHANTVLPYFDGGIAATENLAKTPAAGTSGMTVTTGISYAGSTWSRGSCAAGTGSMIIRQMVAQTDLINNDVYTTSVTVANDQAFSQQIQIDWCDQGNTLYTIAPGEQRRITLSVSKSVYDNIYRFSDLQVTQSSTEGRSILFKDWNIEHGATTGEYYAGTGDYTYGWTGTSNASASVQKATGAVNWAAALNATVAQSAVQKNSQGKSMVVVTRGYNGDGAFASDISGAGAGNSYTMSAWVKPTSSAPISIAMRFKDSGNATISDATTSFTPTIGVWTRISTTAVAPTGSTYIQSMVRVYAPHTGTVFYVDDVLVERASALDTYFDGSTAASGDFTYAWSGTANASNSYQQAPAITAWSPRWYGSAGGNGAFYQAKGGLSGAYARKLWTSANTLGAQDTGINTTTYVAVSANTSYTLSAYVRSSVAQVFNPYIEWYDAGAVKLSATPQGAGVALVANTWTRVSVTGTSASAATSANFVMTPYVGAIAMPYGSTLDFDNVLIEATPVALPYFDGANPIQNLMTNPSFETTLGTWNMVSGGTVTRDTTQGYVGTSCAKINVLASGDGAYFAGNMMTTTAGTVVTTSAWVKAPVGAGFRFDTDSSPDGIGWAVAFTSTYVATGDWQRVSNTVTMPAGTTKMTVGFKANSAFAGAILVDAILVENSTTLNPYYEGTGDFTYNWSGTVNASTSQQKALSPNGLNGSTGIGRVSSGMLSSTTKSSRIVPTSTTQDTYIELTGLTLQTGKTYTVSATLTMFAPQAGSPDTRARRVMIYHSGGTVVSGTQAPNVAGSFRSSATFTVTDGAGYTSLRLYNGASAGAGEVWWDDVLVEEMPTALPYFDGSTAAAGDFTYNWSGVTSASTSVQRATDAAQLTLRYYNTPISSTEWSANGSRSLRIIGNQTLQESFVGLLGGFGTLGGLIPGRTYTALATLRLAAPLTGSLHTRALQMVWRENGNRVAQAIGTNTTGVQQLRLKFTISPSATNGFIELFNGAFPGNGDVWWDKIMIVEGDYQGDYVDGTKPLSKWDGTVHGSTSVGYPPQLLDLAGVPASDITAVGVTTLPGGVVSSAPRTIYTVTQLLTKIPTATLDVVALYGNSDLSDNVANTYMTLRYQSDSSQYSTILSRRTGGGGPIANNVAVGVNVACWGVRANNLYMSHDGQAEIIDSGGVMNVKHEAFSVLAATTTHAHVRSLIYLADHDAATRLAVQRYLGNKYGGNVA